ncbi:ATP-binding protein [Halorientalis brevis]|uniref:histidine kinase n=1 Tax=Halorientalis brevis TaxID=1126241 RepID=A0ABD6CG40_9EURY|nr:HAMP domain-containing sensor histidine kinase [Halorientalis brevis]
MDSFSGAQIPTLLDNIDAGLLMHHLQSGRILDVNDRAVELIGYTRDEFRQMTVDDFSADAAHYSQDEALQRIRAAADAPQRFEWQIQRANGEIRWVQVRLTQGVLTDSDHVFAELRDITRYKTRERQLRLVNRVIRHNLRNQMNVVMGHAEHLSAALEAETLERKAALIVDVADDVGSLNETIQQIETVVDGDSLDREPKGLCVLVDSVVSEFCDRYPTVELSADCDCEVWVTTDMEVQYALEHAIENAIEHNDADSPTVTVSVSAQPDTAGVAVQVADNGPPIPQMEIDALDPTLDTTSTYHGSGIGLWVMEWAMESLGGELSFEANEPRGNVISFHLPTTEPPT